MSNINEAEINYELAQALSDYLHLDSKRYDTAIEEDEI